MMRKQVIATPSIVFRTHEIDGLVQNWGISIADAMEIHVLQSCTKPSKYKCMFYDTSPLNTIGFWNSLPWKQEIVDQWSTRIPPPQRRGWQWAMDCNWTLFKITRQPFWKGHSWQSLGFCLQPQGTCTWNLKVKFQSKLELRCQNHAI